MKQPLTVPELAKRLGYTRERIGQLVRTGVIKSYKVGPNYAISEQEAGKWIQAVADKPDSKYYIFPRIKAKKRL